MLRAPLFALPLILAGMMAQAAPQDDQLLLAVERDLPNYVQGVDASTLRRSQLAAIYSIMYSGKSHFEKTAQIRSTLGGRFSLRGLLFN